MLLINTKFNNNILKGTVVPIRDLVRTKDGHSDFKNLLFVCFTLSDMKFDKVSINELQNVADNGS